LQRAEQAERLQALALLEEQGDQFSCEDVAPSSVRGAIALCLEAGAAGGDVRAPLAQQRFLAVIVYRHCSDRSRHRLQDF
jgi:hypothetical protein